VNRWTLTVATALLLSMPGARPALCMLATPFVASPPQNDSEALFNEAVDAYNHNLFTQALSKFQQVTGPHAAEAQQYINKIKTYQGAVEVAKSAIDRKSDEQDVKNLEFAIQQLQNAISIKSDGPYNVNALLNQARDLKTQVEKQRAGRSKAMDTDYCAKALDAIQNHHYKIAAQFICAVANDNPGYTCGNDEAVHMCTLSNDLAKMDKGGSTAPVDNPPPAPTHTANLDKARAAYDKNDFENARSLLQRADAGSKPEADQYLDKINRYTDAMSNADKLSRDAKYDQARTAYLSASQIKPDGPGDPQNGAARMELFLGLDQFYSGDYASAIQHLQNCVTNGTQKQPLVRFYLGASELARFYVTGSEDTSLRQDAMNDLKQAKQAGFKVTGQDVSPKILQVYKDIAF
jgi:tetratricopeptide (TPR) repeat protein